jgi:hypothetical protein
MIVELWALADLCVAAFAASVLLKTISTNANTIKQWAILNSGATSHILMTNMPATNIVPTTKPIIAHLPNGKRVHSTHICTINIPSSPSRARAAHIIPGLASHSLLSIVSLCNAGCTIHFTKKWMYDQLSWPYHCLRSQMHKDGPLDDPSHPRYKPSTIRLPTYHCHGSQR